MTRRMKVAEVLRTHGLPATQLPTSKNAGREMATAMKSFCTSPEAFVLLLSVDHVALGTNLTAASHVVLVHPLNAESLSSAVAYEKQALARVRRVGQAEGKIHVWRFVTRQTIEEEMHKLHISHCSAAAGA
ncbi:rad8 [Symbiodinium natans]|uniref:Rad8 protein n=1 Tax=Symbiodinium natans TaxID=878477 RepID=A0A812LS92_9DINO|nr:rad8 [Symbiodinium natans]